MGLEVEINFLKDNKFEIIVPKSGIKAYIDSKSKIGDYSPCAPNSSELFLASIGGCILYYAKKYFQDIGISFTKLSVRVWGDWSRVPLQLTDIKVSIFTDAYINEERKNSFLRFVSNCPVHNTIINTKEIKIFLHQEEFQQEEFQRDKL
ncbi:MAG: hypothetical protein DRP68_06060 [Candidatus Omnitrophota bacterium]|nr:MAG: hypothetical protein DRP68_06060 [Candidatus Omnitrophota bacterium]RKY36556.1 MAG: hypothetical protein DRP72_04000 [Candidatus Omnitrophota bacterium]RKY45187.1 MAG: hypothetical protein DRP81_04490 [Candidatus Omnitrophota bacterium]HDN85730.1 OsmC family peroxiredoxin [Candidatus Omnitrophota bacterium]